MEVFRIFSLCARFINAKNGIYPILSKTHLDGTSFLQLPPSPEGPFDMFSLATDLTSLHGIDRMVVVNHFTEEEDVIDNL